MVLRFVTSYLLRLFGRGLITKNDRPTDCRGGLVAQPGDVVTGDPRNACEAAVSGPSSSSLAVLPTAGANALTLGALTLVSWVPCLLSAG